MIFQQQSIATSPEYMSLDEVLKRTSGSVANEIAMDSETERTIKECLKGFFFTDDAGSIMNSLCNMTYIRIN